MLIYKDIFPKEKVLFLKESKLQRAKSIIEYINNYDMFAVSDKITMYLDIAMMECVRFNELQKLNCCMLCLKQGQKLQRSHIIPRSILLNFRKAVKQYSGNVAFQLANPMTNSYEQLFTDKTLTKYMLCKSCEAVLNIDGEQLFYQNFFQKIYDPLNEDCLSLAHEIPYKQWLYYFSIGIIFQSISAFTGIPYVLNDSEVYNLFTCCRKYLLKEEIPVQCLPAVYIFINQTTLLLESEQQWLHETLVGPAMFSISRFQLSDGVAGAYPFAHFILAKVGIINIVVDFSLAKDPRLSQINPDSGLFKVPAEDERHLLPGIKKIYDVVSRRQRIRFQNSMYKKHPFAPKAIDGNSYLNFKKSFKLNFGVDSDQKNIKMEMKEEIVKCLPASFILDRSCGIVEFPSPYILLLHYNIVFSEDMEDYQAIIFIGMQKLKPFFVFYEENSGQSISFGCTFSQSDYSVEEYLTDVPLHTYDSAIVERMKELSMQFIPNAIQNTLINCGFSSLDSLVFQYHYK